MNKDYHKKITVVQPQKNSHSTHLCQISTGCVGDRKIWWHCILALDIRNV